MTDTVEQQQERIIAHRANVTQALINNGVEQILANRAAATGEYKFGTAGEMYVMVGGTVIADNAAGLQSATRLLLATASDEAGAVERLLDSHVKQVNAANAAKYNPLLGR